MKKIFATTLVAALSSSALAEYSTGELGRIITMASGTVLFGMKVQPPNSCNNFTEQVRFDATTQAGKNLLSSLLAAKAANRTVNIWYTASTTPGTSYPTCNEYTMAELTSIAIP